MDAFYASVEQRDNESLQGKPIAVGGSEPRGVVMTASYEARKYGVNSAMPSKQAIRKCPNLIFVPPRFDVYKQVSKQIRNIFHEYTDLVEPLSLDEAYLDVTENKPSIALATLIAKEIKIKIKHQTHLTASAGISINKFLAKIASDMNKPDGLTLISPNKAVAFIESLPIEKFHGIGKVTANKMKENGINTGLDLKEKGEKSLISLFGKMGKFYFKIANCDDDRKVDPHRIRKSVSVEFTFDNDLTEVSDIEFELKRLAHELYNRIQKSKSYGRTLNLKVRYADFRTITRSLSFTAIIKSQEEISANALNLMSQVEGKEAGIRLLGIGISNLENNTGDKTSQLLLDF